MIQAPEGNPLSSTEPVVIEQFGCVTAPKTGAVGVAGCAFNSPDADVEEVQPRSLVTVNVYDVPAASPEIVVVVVPVPVAEPEGDPVMVQVPEAGRPLNAIEPVATVHVG